MKKWRKALAVLLTLTMLAALTACGGETTSSTGSKAGDTSSKSEVSSNSETSETAVEPTDDTGETARNETLYLGGMQWNKPNNMNPMSPNPNFIIMEQSDLARVTTFETLYMFNMLDKKLYPLLAKGDPSWDATKTVLTVKMNPDAKWSDGTPVTAKDVAATFKMHVDYASPTGNDYKQYIESVTAVDDETVEFKCIEGESKNPFKIEEYLPKIFVYQEAFIQTVEERTAKEAGAMKTDEMWDAPYSGAYGVEEKSEQKVILKRNEDYWGVAESMWGKLPAPKYMVHNIYADNTATGAAFEDGKIDVNQQYMPDINKLWEDKGLAISTYYDKPPYHVSATMPSAVFNMTKKGLDQKAVRQAIAYAVDYAQINSSAMTYQSPTFEDVPRSLFNPTDGERAMIKDPATLEPYQWAVKDIEKATKVLDDAGIVDGDGDGIREFEGEKLSFKVECPKGWSDWNAAATIISTAGKDIGIDIETFFPEAAQWTENITTGQYDIAITGYAGASISNPFTRAYQTMYGFGGTFPETVNFNHGRFYNVRADELLKLIPNELDEAKQKEYFEELNIMYLDEVPSFSLMYRPAVFHEVNEVVWTGFPEDGDGTNIPPQCAVYGYGVASLYNISLIEG